MMEESAGAAAPRERKKRKWDQPAEGVALSAAGPAGLVVPPAAAAMFPFAAAAPFMMPGLGMPSAMGGMGPLPRLEPGGDAMVAAMQKTAAQMVERINQELAAKGFVPKNAALPPKEEVSAFREVVINDAEPGIRYRLTKRVIQDEIQRKTRSVIITRGKYRAPGEVAGPGEEKPLYLHISSASDIKDPAEKERAVDDAKRLIIEMMCPPAVLHVGFEAEPAFNLVSRIRGPENQFLEHIAKETGATVTLRGRDSGAVEESGQESREPLHLHISCSNPRGLEDGRRLAENLLDTIRREHAQASGALSARPPPPPSMAAEHFHHPGSFPGSTYGPGGGYGGQPPAQYQGPPPEQTYQQPLPGAPSHHLPYPLQQHPYQPVAAATMAGGLAHPRGGAPPGPPSHYAPPAHPGHLYGTPPPPPQQLAPQPYAAYGRGDAPPPYLAYGPAPGALPPAAHAAAPATGPGYATYGGAYAQVAPGQRPPPPGTYPGGPPVENPQQQQQQQQPQPGPLHFTPSPQKPPQVQQRQLQQQQHQGQGQGQEQQGQSLGGPGPPQRRRFQEFVPQQRPPAPPASQFQQQPDFAQQEDPGHERFSSSAPSAPEAKLMPPPPPRSMPPPPARHKQPVKADGGSKPGSEPVAGLRLVDYGEEEEELSAPGESGPADGSRE